MNNLADLYEAELQMSNSLEFRPVEDLLGRRIPAYVAIVAATLINAACDPCILPRP